jgi:probable rRNA maturation factor
VEKQAKTVLNALGSPDSELSILVVDDSRIEELNQKHLNRKGPTNVIAFPMQEGKCTHINPYVLGDVVISADTAYREAEQAGMAFEDHFTALLVHGILHLFGYDHEKSADEEREMTSKAEALLAMLGFDSSK